MHQIHVDCCLPRPLSASPLQSQFVFIYDALAEFHSCGDTSIVARNLQKELKYLESNGAEGQTGYQQQFEVCRRGRAEGRWGTGWRTGWGAG